MRIPSDEELKEAIDAGFRGSISGWKNDVAANVRALYEGNLMHAHIGKLCEFSYDGEDWIPGKLTGIVDNSYFMNAMCSFKHCRPYYCLQMIEHDGRKLPMYEQRCLVLRTYKTMPLENKYGDFPVIQEDIWPAVTDFLPITVTGEVDYDAIEARGWED